MNDKVNGRNPFRFTLQELGGALGDLGTLLPLMVALILVNGLNTTSVLVGVGLFYIVSGLYYRVPTPVQPLKAVSAIAISLGVTASVIGAAGLLMGVILLLLSLTNLINVIVRLFPRPVVRGIQFSVGLMLLRKGIGLAFSEQVFVNGISHSWRLDPFPLGIILAISALLIFILFRFAFTRQLKRFPASLALIGFGLGAGAIFSPMSGLGNLAPASFSVTLPGAADFWLALIALVVPQLPLTLGNAVVATSDTARVYFDDRAQRVTPRALAASMGIANVAAGLFGAMPMCHGSGGLTAHYKLGARTGGANLMVGGLFLILGGVSLGFAVLPFLELIPFAVLGVLLVIVGIYHALLVRDVRTVKEIATAGSVALFTIVFGNLAYGFVAGIIMFHLMRLGKSQDAIPVVNQ